MWVDSSTLVFRKALCLICADILSSSLPWAMWVDSSTCAIINALCLILISCSVKM
jgi:hypothetical protein